MDWPSRDHFGGACQIHTLPLRQKKWPQLKKKVLKLGILKVIFFVHTVELNEIGQKL